MFSHSLQSIGKSLGTIRYTKQKWHPLVNNGTLQKWHMTKIPPQIDKYDFSKNGTLEKWHTLRENVQRLPYFLRIELNDFQKELLKFVV